MATGKIAGMEASGIGILQRAVELDTSKRYTESLVCYQEGIHILLEVLKTLKDDVKRTHFRQKITEYMDRAEKIKLQVEEEKKVGKYNEQIQIDNNSTGYSYEKVFGRFIDESLTYVEVQDPYIRSVHQVYNFLRLCELLVKSSRGNVKNIELITGRDNGASQQSQQQEHLQELGRSLQSYGVKLSVEYSNTIHDREVRFNNGWIIKIGRGLDYFKAAPSKFSLGYCDFDLRTCHQTTIDILHRKNTKTSELS